MRTDSKYNILNLHHYFFGSKHRMGLTEYIYIFFMEAASKNF